MMDDIELTPEVMFQVAQVNALWADGVDVGTHQPTQALRDLMATNPHLPSRILFHDAAGTLRLMIGAFGTAAEERVYPGRIDVGIADMPDPRG